MKYDTKALKKIGKILDLNKMGTIPAEDEGKVPNPLYSVWIYKDEIAALKKGEIPEGW